MVDSLSDNDNSPPSLSPRRHQLVRHAIVAAAFVLLAFLGRLGLTPVQAIAELLPHGLPFSLDAVLAAASFAIHSPKENIPITLVDIDDDLYREWGRPCITPRDRLAELIAALAKRGPRVIVVDVSLGCGSEQGCCAAGGSAAFETFLRNYSGAAHLLLIREMHAEPSRQANETIVVVDSTPFDAAVAQNPRITWGHTFYLTSEDGMVRRWREEWEACPAGRPGAATESVVSVPTRVLSLLGADAAGAKVPELPARHGACALEKQTGREHLLLLGSRVMGIAPERSDSGAPRRAPARLLADPDRTVDDSGYYALSDRVVILGSSHAASGDQWRTALGYIPGMELVAHTIRFSGAQVHSEGSYWRSLLQVVVAFLLLAAISFCFRPLVAALLSAFAIVVFATICVSLFGWLDIFASLENAIWLFVGYHLVLALIHFIGDTRRYPRWRKVRALLAERVRKGDREWR